MLARSLRAIHLIIRHTQIISRDPDHRPLRPQGFMLERSLHQIVALGERQVGKIIDSTSNGGGRVDIRVSTLRIVVQMSHFLCSGEVGVASGGVVLERDWQIPIQWGEGIVEENLVGDSEDENDDHDNALYFARGICCGVSLRVGLGNEEEEADEGAFHDVKANEELINSGWKQKSTGVGAELGHVEGVVAVDDPEEAKGDDVESKDQRGDNSIDEAYG